MAIEREHRHSVAPTRDLADRARPALDLPRILWRPAARLAVADERSVGDVLELEMPRKALRHDVDLPAQLRRHRPRVIAEALFERGPQPPTAIGVREQPVDPPAQIGDQRRGGVPFGRHAASLAHAPRGDRRGSTLPVGGHRPATTPRAISTATAR